MSGLFIGPLLYAVDLKVSNVSELRWLLILEMPVLLLVCFAWFNLQPARDVLDVTLQSIALVAIFLAPFWWIFLHAQ